MQADNDDKNVDAKISFKDDSQTNASLTFDKTILDLTFSKSPNQKTLDDATTMTVAAHASLTLSFYTKTSVETPGNYTLLGQPSGATISSVTVSTEPTSAEVTGNVPYHATVSARVTLGTASKDFPLTLDYSKYDKQADITRIEGLMSGFTLTGNERAFDLNRPAALNTELSNSSSFVKLQYTTDNST